MKKLFNGFCLFLFIALFIIAVENDLGANNDISLLHISSPPVSSNGHIDSISWYETPTDNIYSDKYEATFINLSKLKPVNTNIWTEEGEYDIISLTQDNQQLLHLFMDGYSVMEGHLDMLPEYQDKLKSVRTKDCFDKNSTNYNLSNQSSETLVFSRKIGILILVPYVFSLVFALMSRNKGNFLFRLPRPPYQAVLRKFVSLLS